MSPKATPLINNFNAGELSPLIDVRSDVNKYYSGCSKMENFFPLVEGGARRVPGTYFCMETKSSSKYSRLIPFVFSTIQSYQLEFGDYYMRVFKDQGQIIVNDSMDDWDPQSPYFVGEYLKIGPYLPLDFGSSKFLYIASPYGQASTVIQVEVTTNTVDELDVIYASDKITIKLAKTTSSKNAANAIQYRIRQLGSVYGVDVTSWTVMENSDYAASRPISATIAAAYLIANASLHQCIQKVDDPAEDLAEKDITAITNAATAMVTAPIHGFSNGDLIHISGVVGMEEVNDLDFAVVNKTLTTFELDNTNSTGYGVYVSGGKVRLSAASTNYFPLVVSDGYFTGVTLGDTVEITTPYPHTDLSLVKYTQSADVMYLFHSSFPPAKLTRHSHINWEYSTPEFVGTEGVARQGYLGQAKQITFITKAPQALVTCREHGFADGDRVYIDHVLGMLEVNAHIYTVSEPSDYTFKLLDTDSTSWNTFYVDPSGEKNGTATKVISLFAATGDYPSCGVFHKQRLCLAGFPNSPSTFKLSMVANYELFVSDPLSSDASIEFTLVSSKSDSIRWLASLQSLIIGTVGGVVVVGAETVTEAFSQTNVDTKKTTTVGVSDIQPVIGSDTLMWLTRAGISVRLLIYSLQEERWVAPDMMRVASHISMGASREESGIVAMDFQHEPHPILWCVRADGQLCGMTFNLQEQVYGWFRVVTDGQFESVSVISVDSNEDQVWVIVNRTIDGVTKRYVEYFTPHEFFSSLPDCFYLHSGLSWDGGDDIDIQEITNTSPPVVFAPGHSFVDGDHVFIDEVEGMTEVNLGEGGGYLVNNAVAGLTFELYGMNAVGWGVYTGGGIVRKVKREFTNLSHLEGKSVGVLADGGVYGPLTITSGSVNIGGYANTVHIGLPYVSTITTMKLHAGSPLGTARSKLQKVHRITVAFNESVGGKYGPSEDDLYVIPFGTGANPVLHTEDVQAEFKGNWDKYAQLCINQEQPLPMTILALVPRVSLEES